MHQMIKAVVVLIVSFCICSTLAIAEVCSGNGAYHEGSPCVCPPPLKKMHSIAGAGHWICAKTGEPAQSSDEGVAIIRRDRSQAEQPPNRIDVPKICDVPALEENFRWFHRDASVNRHTAAVRGEIARQANGLVTPDISAKIREAYKDGQQHNAQAQNLIDSCDDYTVWSVAYRTLEEVRLKACGAPAPATSATCYDLRGNIDFSLYKGSRCSSYARLYVKYGIYGPAKTLNEKARLVRVGLKIAQGHKQEVFDSFDYIGDELLLTMTKSLFEVDGAGKLSAESPERDLQCPGWARVLQQSGIL